MTPTGNYGILYLSCTLKKKEMRTAASVNRADLKTASKFLRNVKIDKCKTNLKSKGPMVTVFIYRRARFSKHWLEWVCNTYLF